jgi:hypothetical protein
MVSAAHATRTVLARREATPRFAVRAALPRVLAVVAYAIAMAYVESAAVLYLRTIYGGVDPVGPRQVVFDPLPDFVWVEIGREAATMVMLAAVAYLAASSVGGRMGAFAVAMGVWDIFYYVFLWIICDWPRSLLDWDILFLLPLPWWGPVIAPVSIALLMIAWGTFATQFPDHRPATGMTWAVWGSSGVGIALALYVFMADALQIAHQGRDVLTRMLPTAFNWSAFCVAFALMATPVAHIGWRLRSRRHEIVRS